MKRILTLAMAAALVLGTVCTASAVDVKVKGTWEFAFGWADNTAFEDHSNKNAGRNNDPFQALQRFRTQIDFIASENLSGVLFFEIGNMNWGRNGYNAASPSSGRSSGGALDGDGVNVETKRAYLDWMVPSTDLSIRMGLQGLALPSGTNLGSPILNADVAALVATNKFNDMVSLTAFWARPFDAYANDSSSGLGNGNRNLDDEMDIFGLILPLTFDGFKITPWGVYAQIGGASNYWGYRFDNQRDAGYKTVVYQGNTEAWWAGTAFELSMFNPLTFGMDVMYGDVHGHGNSLAGGLGKNNYGSRGWFIDANLNYKLDWGTPGLFGWWSSGDDANAVHNGKFGRMPIVSADSGFAPTSFGFDGSQNGIIQDTIVSRSGIGMWGVGVQIKDMSFVEKLSHTLRVTYYQGTNDHKILSQYVSNDIGRLTGGLIYMTDKDQAIEVNFDHKYQIYENLAAMLDLGYIHMNLDSSWKNTYRKYSDTSDAWKAQLGFQYKF